MSDTDADHDESAQHTTMQDKTDGRESGRESETVNPEYADADDGEFVSFEEVTYQRDSQGNLKAEDVHVRELDGMARAVPMNKSQREMISNLQDPDSDRDELTDAELAELFDRNLKKPDLTQHPRASGGRVTEGFVSNEMPQTMQDGCFMAILLASKEYDMVRLLRNELTDSEIKMAVAAMNEDGDADQQGNPRAR